jgi:membrane-bound lytic murein transglycosylase D
MRRRSFQLALILSAFSLTATVRAETFPRPATLEPQIKFWRSIFSEYSKYQVVLHDAVDLDKVYKVLDFRPYLDQGMTEGEVERLLRSETSLELDRVAATLRRLHQVGGDPTGLSAEDRHVYDLYKNDNSPDRFLEAAGDKRLHSQRGLREKFMEGLRVGRHFFPDMERIFRDEGLPAELTRLPLIESCFNLNAYSKVGAAGIWQFMPSTGRHFMEVNAMVDERRDPLASTRAAARFLSQMHDDLNTWPLAITGWNHGPEGVGRAARFVGTSDIGIIVRDYHGPSFGFASRNFYAEFLAALDVDKETGRLEGPPVVPFLRSRQHRLDRSVGIEVAARLAGTDRDTIAELNPALMGPVVAGHRQIPRGYHLRVPGGTEFESRLAELSAEEQVTRVSAVESSSRRVGGRSAAVSQTHRVKSGQTLSHIAKRYNVSVASLRNANGLGKKKTLKPGQVIRIPRKA